MAKKRKMRFPKDLTRKELERIAEMVQNCLYRNYNQEPPEDSGLPIRPRYDPDKDFSGADTCQYLAELLSDLNMVPDEPMAAPD